MRACVRARARMCVCLRVYVCVCLRVRVRVRVCAYVYVSSYISIDNKRIAKFHFPLKNPDLNQLWARFVNCTDWKATKHFVICELHFEEKFIHLR